LKKILIIILAKLSIKWLLFLILPSFTLFDLSLLNTIYNITDDYFNITSSSVTPRTKIEKDFDPKIVNYDTVAFFIEINEIDTNKYSYDQIVRKMLRKYPSSYNDLSEGDKNKYYGIMAEMVLNNPSIARELRNSSLTTIVNLHDNENVRESSFIPIT
jgi:hypothetical protein